MGFTAAGIAIDTVTTDQQAPMGFELTKETPTIGLQVWVYIQMTGSAAGIGEVIRRDVNIPYVGKQGLAAATKIRTLGVAQHLIPQNSYGFILKKGYGLIDCSAAVTAGDDLVPTAAGKAKTMAAGEENHVMASSLVTAGGAAVNPAMISCGV